MLCISFDSPYNEQRLLEFLSFFLYSANNAALVAQNQTGENKVFLQLTSKISMKVIHV